MHKKIPEFISICKFTRQKKTLHNLSNEAEM